MIWVYIGLAAVLGVVIALAVVAAGRESNERRGGMLELDTVRARSALRRCNPVRDVHYHEALSERCECGARESIRGLVVPVVTDPTVTPGQPRFVVTWPPEGDA